jgi:ubiquinone/menaquinone biosynthesis C-methylase UbiE
MRLSSQQNSRLVRLVILLVAALLVFLFSTSEQNKPTGSSVCELFAADLGGEKSVNRELKCSTPFPSSIACPPSEPINLTDKWAKEYDSRMKQGLCDRHGVWAQDITRDDHYALFRSTASAIQLSADTEIMNVGSGCGHTERIIVDEFGARVFAIELIPGMVEYAKKLLSDSDHIKFCQGSATNLSTLPARSFDFVMSVAVFYMLPDGCDALWTIVNTLRPGGVFWLGWNFFFSAVRKPDQKTYQDCFDSWKTSEFWMEIAKEEGKTRQPKFQKTSSIFFHRRCHQQQNNNDRVWKSCWYSSRRVYPNSTDFYSKGAAIENAEGWK